MITIKAILGGLVGISICIADISGIVTDTSGKLPLSGATVKLEKGGQTAITGTNGQFTLVSSAVLSYKRNSFLSSKIFAVYYNGLLYVNLSERSPVEIAVFDLSGKVILKAQQGMEAGSNSYPFPNTGAGIYLCKIKAGVGEVVLKCYTTGLESPRSIVSAQRSSRQKLIPKQAAVTALINDVIMVMKAGYLNYRLKLINSDTSGMEIKMIECADTVRDADGNVYQAVRIGNQIWTTENLRVTRYNDGSAIQKITDSATWDSCSYTYMGAFCYYRNTANADSINKFGSLYNFFAIETKRLSPAGWHVPSDSEWSVLETYLIANGYNWDGTTVGNKIAKALAAMTDWGTSSDSGDVGNNLAKNNRSGFSALPGGCRYTNGVFGYSGSYGFWWHTVTGLPSTQPRYRALCGGSENIDRFDGGFREWGYSVRLIKN